MSEAKLPPRIRQGTRDAITHLIEGRAKTVSAAARLAGISRTELSRNLNRPHIQAYVIQTATAHLKGLPLLLATARLHRLVGAKSEDVAARVATRIAEAGGVLAPRESSPGAAGATGSGPVLIVKLSHVTVANPPGNGAELTHAAAIELQATDVAGVFEGDPYRDKVADGGQEGRVAEGRAPGPGVEKTRPLLPPPPSHVRKTPAAPAGIIFDPDRGAE